MSSDAEHNAGDGPGFFGPEMRIDPAHSAPRRMLHGAGERVSAEPVGAAIQSQATAASSVVEHSLDMLREHAAQLADRLQDEQVSARSTTA